MRRYENFIKFAESKHYIFNEEEKQFFLSFFNSKTVNYKFDFGNKKYIKILLEYFKHKNIYKDTFNHLNI